MRKTISAGNVVRWFCVDWEFFGGAKAGTAFHDEVLNELLKKFEQVIQASAVIGKLRVEIH